MCIPRLSASTCRTTALYSFGLPSAKSRFRAFCAISSCCSCHATLRTNAVHGALLRRGLSTTSGKPKPKPLPSARVRFSNHTEVHIVGTRHTAGSIGPVQRMVRSLPPNSAVAFEQCVLQTLVTLRHSEYDGPTPLPPLPLNPETRIAADSNFSLVAEWQEFFKACRLWQVSARDG